MALPTPHPLNEVVVYAHNIDISSAGSSFTRAPFRGKIVKLGVIIHAASITADNAISSKINGTAITGGTATQTFSGSAAGDVFTAIPTAANAVNEDDKIEFISDGAGSGTVPATYFAVVRRG